MAMLARKCPIVWYRSIARVWTLQVPYWIQSIPVTQIYVQNWFQVHTCSCLTTRSEIRKKRRPKKHPFFRKSTENGHFGPKLLRFPPPVHCQSMDPRGSILGLEHPRNSNLCLELVSGPHLQFPGRQKRNQKKKAEKTTILQVDAPKNGHVCTPSGLVRLRSAARISTPRVQCWYHTCPVTQTNV